MPPRSAVRASGKPRPMAKPKITPADRVRLEWAAFETWLSVQRKEVEIKKNAKLQELRQQMESTKKTIPKGFHPTLMREYEEGKRGVAKEVEYELVLHSRDEWEERLDKAGLKAEDWDPMTFAEQETVRKALASNSDDEEYTTHATFEAVDNYTMQQHATIVQQTSAHLDVPTFSKWAADAERTKSLSPLPGLPDGFRSQTPNRIPPTPPYTPGHTALFGETKPLGTRYTGPVLTEENKNESPEDADFANFKMTIREQMIREFHDEAAAQEIMLVRKEHEVKLEADAVKALVAGHELNMEELRRQKEGKRKALVDAERTKRKADIRRRNSAPKGIQSDLAVQIENLSRLKGQSKLSGQANPPPANETLSVPAVLAETASTLADVPASSNQPAIGKTETKKQKKAAKSSKKAAASRVQLVNPKTDGSSEKQEGPAEVVQSSETKTQAKPRGILKNPTPRTDKRPTVEEVSDEEADPWVSEHKTEAPKQQASGPAGIFFEPQRAPSTHPFGSDSEDDRMARFSQTPGVSKSKKMKESVKSSLPRQQAEVTTERSLFSDDENQGYWDIINGGMSLEQHCGDVSESAGSTGGKHAVWAPPAFHDDDSEDDSEGLFNSFAFGGMGPIDDMSSAPWAVGGLDCKDFQSSVHNPYEKNVTVKADPRNRNVPRKGGTVKEVSAQNGTRESGRHDDTDWEAMMGKFLGLTHGPPN